MPYFKSSKYAYSYLASLLLRHPNLCYGNEPIHKLQIHSFKRFLQAYKVKRKFAFSWLTSTAHHDPNHLDFADKDFELLFQFMKNQNFLKNTILIVMGDHGSAYSSIRNTPIGRIEERMPLFSMVVPEHLKKKYPQLHRILTINTERLVSHFDAHATMVDVLTRSFLMPSKEKSTLGVSLFKEIPKIRTCKHAGIPDAHCPCYVRVTISNNTLKVHKIAKVVVERINQILSDVKNVCSKLKLSQIENAQVVKPNFSPNRGNTKSLIQHIFRSTETKDEQYFLLLRTHPGNGLFESMALYKGDGDIEITENISRSNRYGNQSHCVTQTHFKPYCF